MILKPKSCSFPLQRYGCCKNHFRIYTHVNGDVNFDKLACSIALLLVFPNLVTFTIPFIGAHCSYIPCCDIVLNILSGLCRFQLSSLPLPIFLHCAMHTVLHIVPCTIVNIVIMEAWGTYNHRHESSTGEPEQQRQARQCRQRQ